jgi:hypothetical protein
LTRKTAGRKKSPELYEHDDQAMLVVILPRMQIIITIWNCSKCVTEAANNNSAMEHVTCHQ